MKESFEIKKIFKNVNPSEIYEAWLNSKMHTEMTGGGAKCSSEVDASFTAWDGYISGKNLELKPNKEIVQSWRTAEFDSEDEDSKIIVALRKVGDGTELTLAHTNIPEGQTQYKEGWEVHYFTPMKNYFDSKNNNG